MKPTNRIKSLTRGFFPAGSGIACLLLIAGIGTAPAQDMVAPREVEDITPPALQPVLPAAKPVAPVMAPDTPLLQKGPVTVRSHFLYRFLYGDGIPSRPGRQLTTAIHDIAPTLLLDLGTRWIVDYTPTRRIYSNDALRDTLDHSARLAGGATYEDWVFHVSEAFSSSSPPLVETGRQTKQHTWATAFNATYRLGSRAGIETAFNLNERYAEGSPDYREWSNQDWLQFQLSPQAAAGIGIDIGYVEILSGPDMDYLRPQARMTWQPTDKTRFSLRGGVERRNSRAIGASNLNNPILDASIDYQPFESTQITLGVERAVATSYFANQVTESTGWSAGLEQRLLGRFYLRVNAGHRKTEYAATAGSIVAGRDDKLDTIDARLSTVLRGRATIAAVYRHSRNSSNLAGFDLTSDQGGVEIGYRY